MSTYGKLTIPTADVFKSQNNIASIDDNGKLLSSQLPSDVLTASSLTNTDLKVKSLEINSENGHGILQGNNYKLDISGDSEGISLRSIYNNSDVAKILINAQEGRDYGGNIWIKSNANSGYEQGEINISSSDGNNITLGDNQFKLSSVFTTTNEGSEISLTPNEIKVVGAIQTTITNDTNKEEITVGVNGIILDSKNLSPISLKNATSIELVTQNSGKMGLNDGHLYMDADYITLTSIGSSGIVLNGYNAKLFLTSDDVSFTIGDGRGRGLFFSEELNQRVLLQAGYGEPYLSFITGSKGKHSIYLDTAEDSTYSSSIIIEESSYTSFKNNKFEFEPCLGITDPVYITVPVVDSTTNKLDGTYARLYVSKNSSGALELKVEADR